MSNTGNDATEQFASQEMEHHINDGVSGYVALQQ
jgi:hypothetical protein